MPADNVRNIEDVPEFSTPTEAADGSKSEQRFKWDGETYTLRRPKMVIAMTMLRLAEGDEMSTATDNGMDMVKLISSVIAYIKKEKPGPDGELRGQAHLLHRLNDPGDDLDIMHLAEPFAELVGRVFGRPTKAQPGSAPKRARASRAGVGSSRSRRAVTSGS